LKYIALYNTVIDDELYKQVFDWNLARCLAEEVAYVAFAEIHEGVCGAHQAVVQMN